jgi:gamma-glutamylputrescine oxidase
MISFWERESLLHTNVAIIGGGIVGLSAAASLAESNPNLNITIFERSILPYGASTRNAGFACFGSLTEVLSDIEIMGESAARELVFQRWIGLQITRQRLGDAAIGFEPNEGFELIREKELPALEQIESVNALVSDFLPDYLSIADSRFAEFGLRQNTSDHLVRMADEGQVNTGKLMHALEKYVLSLGVQIRTGAFVKQITETDQKVLIEVEDQTRGSIAFSANQLVVCSNAFTKQLLPKTDLYPGRGQVFITKPIDGLNFKGNLHIDEGFYYLRNVGNRLLFGGARNFDFEKENTTDFALNNQIQSHLEDYLHDLLPDISFEVDQRWAGIMAFGKTKQPIVERISAHTSVAVKMGGMGIALAGNIGEMVKEILEE